MEAEESGKINAYAIKFDLDGICKSNWFFTIIVLDKFSSILQLLTLKEVESWRIKDDTTEKPEAKALTFYFHYFLI